MSQPALIETLIKALGLEDDPNQHQKPVVSPPLHCHEDSEEFNGQWNYQSLILMLTYLARNTCPDSKYDVHWCTLFQYNPKKNMQCYQKDRNVFIGKIY